MDADAEHRNQKILLFPYLAYGHITAFFELAKKLSDRGFSVDFCSTPINLSFIKKKFPEKYCSSIKLVEFNLPDLPELPPHYHTTNGLPLHLKPTLFKAMKLARPNFHQILKDKKPNLIIYDIMLLWVAKVAFTYNIPAIKFYTVNAAVFGFLNLFYYNPGQEFPFPALYLLDHEKEKVSTDVTDDAEVEIDRDNITEADLIVLVDTSRAIDGKYTDYACQASPLKIIPIGTRFQNQDNEAEETELMKWLGEKKERSTVFVSFGSEYFLTKEEMEEVAYGLELSDVDFIWVVRFQKGEEDVKLEEALPGGFLERMGEKGRIVEWAPQMKILKHPSIGAFVSHCGWNSTQESIECGVPIIAMPMLYDQPLNARLMVENGVAVEVARENGKLNRDKIAEAIKDVIGTDTGEDLRKKMISLGDNVRSQREEELDGLVEVITEQINKRSQS